MVTLSDWPTWNNLPIKSNITMHLCMMVWKKPLVCYNPDLYNLMQQAHTVDRPVRITNFHEKIDEFNDKSVSTLGQQSRV